MERATGVEPATSSLGRRFRHERQIQRSCGFPYGHKGSPRFAVSLLITRIE